MATYSTSNFSKVVDYGSAPNQVVAGLRWIHYVDTSDTVANIVTDITTNTRDLTVVGVRTGDILIVVGSDGVGLRYVSNASAGGLSALA